STAPAPHPGATASHASSATQARNTLNTETYLPTTAVSVEEPRQTSSGRVSSAALDDLAGRVGGPVTGHCYASPHGIDDRTGGSALRGAECSDHDAALGSTAIASIETSRPRGSRPLAGAD